MASVLEKRILSSNDAGLIAILYEALINNFDQSIVALKEGDYREVNELNNHSRDILAELMVQFNGDENLSIDLTELNLYINNLITVGLCRKDISAYEHCIKIATPILEGFQELEVKLEPKTVAGFTYGKNNINEHMVKGNRTFEG